MIYYIYNDIDDLIGFKYNNEVYYYIKNAQEDVIGILNSNNNVVANYSYDAWGKVISVTGSNNIDVSTNMSHIANINPFRYRSYYYDIETSLYYLNSRYYNPVWGRFINVDGIIGANQDINSYNLYTYVSNNPIGNVDSTGKWKLPKWAKFTIGVVAVIAAVTIVAATAGAASIVPALIGATKVVAASVAVSLTSKVVTNVVSSIDTQSSLKKNIDNVKNNAFEKIDDAVADGVMCGGLSTLAIVGTHLYLGKAADSGFKFGERTEGMYRYENNNGGTIISTKFNNGNKFRLDLDIENGFHWHFGKGKSYKDHHIIVTFWETIKK